ncbi:MAG TPA: citrate synthase [Verrucomicrobia bacterium]|nr:citrate synthase [Verrucomicrobiota bacterium]
MEDTTLLDRLYKKSIENNVIPQKLYEQYNVKRGLRNPDGTGVLVGLTNVGEVHGYVIDENEKVAIPGKLYYRGYDVETLIAGIQQEKRRFGFEETCYLLLFGALPNADELKAFARLLGEYRMLPQNFTVDMILKVPSRNIMNKLARSVLVLYSYDEQADDISVRNVLDQSMKLIARFPTLASYAYQAIRRYYNEESLFLHNPDPELSTAENLLRMTRDNTLYTPLEAELLDLMLILHAEHGGGNNSTFTMHVVTSSATDTYAAVSAAVGSLKGPRHGGASGQVHEMMTDLRAQCGNKPSEQTIQAYLEKLMDRQAFDESGLIYGMGHAVYTISDPRVSVLRDKARELAEFKGLSDTFNIYEAVERIAPGVFQRKKGSDQPLCANVDLYSGFVYSMLGFPEALFTPLFAISRIAGWSAHRLEQLITGGKIIRPAYKSVCKRQPYVPLADRL